MGDGSALSRLNILRHDAAFIKEKLRDAIKVNVIPEQCQLSCSLVRVDGGLPVVKRAK